MGFLDLIYLSFYDSSRIVNAPSSVLSVSRLNLYQGFETNLQGNIQLPDATRIYNEVNSTNGLCLGSFFPNATQELTSGQCEAACENSPVCSGYIASIDEDTFAPQCVLCEQEEACTYDCSSPDRQYFIASSKFLFTSVSACLRDVRPLNTITGASLEQCKLYCTYYESCEGFRLIGDSSNVSCELIADLDFDNSCSQTELVYIPFLGDPKDHLQVNGALMSTANLISTHSGINSNEFRHHVIHSIPLRAFQNQASQPRHISTRPVVKIMSKSHCPGF